MSDAQPDLRVDRARLANARPGDRDRLATAFARVTPAATGMSDRGLLLIRKLRMERPLGAGLDSFANELIDRIRAEKVTARRGAVETGGSVYFEDEVALEVALVRTWLEGGQLPAVVRKAVAQGDAPRLRWRRKALGDPRKLPRMIAALVEAGLAGHWFAHFDAAELRPATELLVRSYGGDLACFVQARDVVVSVDSPERVAPTIVPTVSAVEEVVALARTAAPDPAARSLIAVSLLAIRRPELLATRAAIHAFATLAKAKPSQAYLPPTTEQTAMPAVATAALPPVPRSDPSPVGVAGSHHHKREEVSNHPSAACPAAMPSQQASSMAASVSTSVLSPPPPAAPATTTPTTLPASVASDHAGLFFLLNIFLALGLYGDFTDPGQRVRGLSPFELLHLLGRRWIGPTFAGDPLAPLLRELAGLGPRELIGRNFEAPAWQVPPDWLASWPAEEGRVIRSRHGESRRHSCGFTIADHWHVPRPEAWMRRRWSACLARYLEARIARALGTEDRARAIATLVRQHGTIEADAEHVTVSFVLDVHPLELRLAGLDRDPGWIPAAGRSFGFRFT